MARRSERAKARSLAGEWAAETAVGSGRHQEQLSALAMAGATARKLGAALEYTSAEASEAALGRMSEEDSATTWAEKLAKAAVDLRPVRSQRRQT